MAATETPPTPTPDLPTIMKGYVSWPSSLLLASLGAGVVLWEVEGKFRAFEGKLEGRLTALEGRMEGKFRAFEGKMEGRLTALEGRIDKVEQKLDHLREPVSR